MLRISLPPMKLSSVKEDTFAISAIILNIFALFYGGM